MHSLHRLSRSLMKLKIELVTENLSQPPSQLKPFFRCKFCSSTLITDAQKLVLKSHADIVNEGKESEDCLTEKAPIVSDLCAHDNEKVDCTVKHFQNYLPNQTITTQIPLPSAKRDAFADIEDEIKEVENFGVSHFIDDIAPPLPASFNFAAYANRSPTLKKLVKLGVDLSKIEEKAASAKFIMSLDFHKDMKPYIQFLHDVGVLAHDLGNFVTKNPFIFKEDLDDLQVRINYLQSKKFSDSDIARIITKNPSFLSLNTKNVDRRLGYFQYKYHLSGNEIRLLITKYAKLVTHDYEKLLEKEFVLKEEMGFSDEQVKALLLSKPKMWTLGRKSLSERFSIVHQDMGISHELIVKFPVIFFQRAFLTRQRHKYLVELGRAQYDPSQPGYISLKDFICPDAVFCRNSAKTSVVKFNEFLKTL